MKKRLKRRKLGHKIKRTRVRLVKKFADLLVKRFEDNLKSVFTFGSGVRKAETFNDLDVGVLLDDTKLRRPPSHRMKDDLFDRLNELAKKEVDERLHVQIYFLTDFWNNVRSGDPIIMSIIKDSIIVYDVGVLEPIRNMLERGLISGTKESIDKRLDMGPDILKAADRQITSTLRPLDDAVIETARAVIMEAGLISPPPKKVPVIFRELFVKEGLIDKKYGDILEKIHKTYKDWEHGKINNLSGKEIDKFKKDAERFIKQIPILVKKVKIRKRARSVDKALALCADAVKEALKSVGKEKAKKPITTFEKLFVGKGKPISKSEWFSFMEVVRIHKLMKTKGIDTLTITDTLDVKEHSERFAKAVYEMIKPRHMRVLEEKPHLVCKTKDGYALAWFCKDRVFAIPDPKSEQVLEARVGKNKLSKFHKSSLDKLANTLENEKDMCIRKDFVKGLKSIIGKPEDMYIEYRSGYKVRLKELI